MSRIIFVPQYPTPMRYQEWWWYKLPEEFSEAGFDVMILGADAASYIKASSREMFSPVDDAIDLETAQIKQYMGMNLRDDDILFMADLSFPGLFGNVLFHKRPNRCFAYCHATSKNKLDYFAKDRHSKFSTESAIASLMDVVFIGSNYHDDKLRWINTKVVRLPNPPFEVFKEEKVFDIISVARPTDQKVDIEIEKKLEEKFKYPIVRQDSISWKHYYKFLSKAKILLITSKEDTFNYSLLEALNNNTIVIAPNKLCFPELLAENYLYNDFFDLKSKLDKYLNYRKHKLPRIKCEKSVNNFFNNIINIMKTR